MSEDKNNILLVGDNGASYALARKLSENENVGQIYITSSVDENWEFFKKIDIRDDDLNGLLVFALENNINITIPISEKALKSDIVSFFQSNGQNIFGGVKSCTKLFLNKILCKKFLYRLHAPIAKFAIHNKTSQALEYIEHCAFPVVIRTAENTGLQNDRMICTSIKSAQNFLDTLFSRNETDVLIENYTYGHSFTVYFITDGYTSIPINIAGNNKFLNNFRLYDGVGCYVPDYKIPSNIVERVSDISQNILADFDANSNPYMGIFGIECILLKNGNFIVQDIKPFLQDYDASAILNSIDDDILKIMYSCINGFFSDEYESIRTNDYSSICACVFSKYEGKEIKGLDKNNCIDFINVKKVEDKFYTKEGLDFCLTKTSATLTRAKDLLQEELSEIDFEGVEYKNFANGY